MAHHYTGLIDGADGVFGVTFPDLEGCTAMGASPDEAQVNAMDALRDWLAAMDDDGHDVPASRSIATLLADARVRGALASGAVLSRIPVVGGMSRPTETDLSLDSGVLSAIDAAARRLKLSRSAVVELLARRGLSKLA